MNKEKTTNVDSTTKLLVPKLSNAKPFQPIFEIKTSDFNEIINWKDLDEIKLNDEEELIEEQPSSLILKSIENKSDNELCSKQIKFNEPILVF